MNYNYDKFAAHFEFIIMINSRHLTPNTNPITPTLTANP